MLTSVPMTPPWDQGDKNLAYTLTQAMHEHRFRVLTQRHGLSPAGKNLDRIPLYLHRVPGLAEKARVYWYLLSNPKQNGAVLKSTNSEPDLYHMVYRSTRWSAYFMRLLPRFKKRPTIHTLPALNLDDEIHSGLYFADCLVVLSEHARASLRGLGFENVVHIPSGIDLELWSDLATQKSHYKRHLRIDARPVVLYPGHFSPGYGSDLILDILPELVAQKPELLLLCACRLRSPGDRAREDRLKRSINALGLAGNVRFYHTVEDMRPLIAASDVTILPVETMRDKLDIPTTLLESMAASVPIIISDLAPLNELMVELSGRAALKPGEIAITRTGIAIPPGDDSALAHAILTILDNRSLRRRMGNHGQAFVSDNFDIIKVAQKYQQIYIDLSL